MPENISSQFHRLFSAPIEDNRSVETILERDSIPSNLRWEGMHVYVSQDGEKKTYELRGGIGNENWEPISDINIDVAVDIAFSETSENPVQNQVITNGMYQRTQLQTSGQAQVHWDNLTDVPDLVEQAELSDYQLRSEKGQANGYASLDGNGQVPISQLPTELVRLLGDWNADTNTPTLANGTGIQGDAYKVSVAGTTDFGDGPITFAVDDLVVYDGSVWEKITGGFAYQNLTFSGGDLSISNGNTVNLDSRYYTETETDGLLSDKANDTDVLHTTGNETKTGQLEIEGGSNVEPMILSRNTAAGGLSIRFQNQNHSVNIGMDLDGDMVISPDGQVSTNGEKIATETWVNSQGFLTADNLGFGLSWNSSTNEVDWGEHRTIGTSDYYILPVPDNSIFALGDIQNDESSIFVSNNSEEGTAASVGTSNSNGRGYFTSAIAGGAPIIEMSIVDSNTDFKSIRMLSASFGIQIVDDIDGIGLIANNDFSSNYSPLSYVQKTYVDQAEYLKSLPNYSASVEQVLGHDASGNLTWINN